VIESVIKASFGVIQTVVDGVAKGFETLVGWVQSAIEWIQRFNQTDVEDKNIKQGSMGSIGDNVRQFIPDGKRALGGPVNANGTYLVGERGPELVTFGRSGMVTPNSDLGGQTITVTINNPVMTDKRMIDEIGKQLVSTLRSKGLVTT
jgi:hypothetical protein